MSILDSFRVDGKVALVTGAGRGIGRASAIALAEGGADVVVAARTTEQVDEVAEHIRSLGRRAVPVSFDVMELDRLGELVDLAVGELGGLDLLVNNAGGSMPKALLDTSVRSFERALTFNVTTAFELTKQAVPAMLDTLHGDRERYATWAQSAVAADVQLYYQIGLLCRRDISYAPDARSGVEMAMLRMLAFRPATATDIQPGPARMAALPRADTPAREAPVSAKKPEPAAAGPAGPVTTETPDQAASQEAGEPRHDIAVPARFEALYAENWAALLARLELVGMARSVASNSVPERIDNDMLHLVLQEQQAMLYNPQCDERIGAALSVHFGRTIRVATRIGTPGTETPATRELRIQAARQRQAIAAIEADANVRALLDEFAGRLHRDSIRVLSVPSEGAMAHEEL